MAEGSFKDAKQARYLRKQQKQAGYDEDQEDEDKVFREDMDKALKTYGKSTVTKDIQKQIQYFGYKIEPFNMKQEEELGEIDEDGFFVFSKKRQQGDRWLQSLEDPDEAGLRKKIKEEHRFQNVYDADVKLNDQLKSDEEDPEPQEEKEEESQVQIEDKDKFDGKEIKTILADLLPYGTNANQYMKSLKKQRNNQLYQKILYLCNEYVASTGQYDIFTLKKEDIEQEVEGEEQAPLNNWDQNEEESAQDQPLNQKAPEAADDEDDIF